MRATLRIDIAGELYRAVESSGPLRPSCCVDQSPVHAHDAPPEYRFCPCCGGALEQRVIKASEPERLVCIACGFSFDLHPMIDVGTRTLIVVFLLVVALLILMAIVGAYV